MTRLSITLPAITMQSITLQNNSTSAAGTRPRRACSTAKCGPPNSKQIPRQFHPKLYGGWMGLNSFTDREISARIFACSDCQEGGKNQETLHGGLVSEGKTNILLPGLIISELPIQQLDLIIPIPIEVDKLHFLAMKDFDYSKDAF
jgi:hypothetical protein